MRDKFDYMVFGLRVRSEIALPELPKAQHVGAPDVEIALGSLPPADRSADGYLLGADGAGFIVDEVAGYWVNNGSLILIEPQPSAPARNIRLYLLGSAMGILLHQRGLLPLHANAIDIGGRAIAFAGRSGAGKSTLAGAFLDAGYSVLADDICVISFDGGMSVVHPGLPRLRLSEEAMAAAGRKVQDFSLSYEGDDNFRKFDVPIPAGRQAVPLLAVYLLAEGDVPAFRRLQGAAAAEVIFANTYRGSFVRSGGLPLTHWELSLRLIESVPVFEYGRPRELARMSDNVRKLVDHATRIAVERPNLSAD